MITKENRIMAELCFVHATQAQRAQDHKVSEHWYENALALDPDNEDFNYSAIYPYALQHKYPEAIAQATKAMQSPTHKDNAQYTRSLLYLNTNDYISGFKDFEIRLKQRPIANIHEKLCVKPYWNGEYCKTLYIFGEQGFGDIIMFSRYISLIKTKFKVDKIYFEVPKSCADLFKYNFRNDPDIEVISVRSTYELLGTDKEFLSSDYYIQQLSLARLFGTTFETVPDIKIEAEPEYIEKFKHLSEKPTVALCPGGRPMNGDPFVEEWNSRRNVDKAILDEIVKDFNIVYLQQELNPSLKNWSDTAGTLANVKFVISIDSGPVHLAGAMGINTILLNHFQHCWRWNSSGKSPWYKNNLKQIRQIKEYDWSNVFTELKEEIKNYVQII